MSPNPVIDSDECIKEGLLDLDIVKPCTKKNPCLLDRMIYQEILAFQESQNPNYETKHKLSDLYVAFGLKVPPVKMYSCL